MHLAAVDPIEHGVLLDGEHLSLDELSGVCRRNLVVALSPAARQRVQASRALVDGMIGEGRVVYGVTTGFGKCSEVAISPGESSVLQRNLLLSHAAGVGEYLPEEVVRAVMLLRANALAKGFSGVRPEIIEILLGMLEKGVHPLIPGQGSLGASGDLAPLAHMSLVLIGEGEAFWHGLRLSGAEALSRAGLAPLELRAKEGLALINGTQVMNALLALAVLDAGDLLLMADLAAALAFDALGGIGSALDPRIHEARPHRGQGESASRLRKLLADSERLTAPGEVRIQDAYTLRCTPQVHGASWDALRHVRGVAEVEMNAATDNPLLFVETGEAISGGNFHGQPLALAADYLTMAMAEAADIAERRIERMVNPSLSGLPAFLTPRPGLNSGLMIVQYTAASLVSENKVLAHPASVDSIPSSANQEDHVSMGSIAARKLRQVLINVRRVLAIELLTAAQACDLGPQDRRLGLGTGAAHRALRAAVPFMDHDRPLHKDIEIVDRLLCDGTILQAVDQVMDWR